MIFEKIKRTAELFVGMRELVDAEKGQTALSSESVTPPGDAARAAVCGRPGCLAFTCLTYSHLSLRRICSVAVVCWRPEGISHDQNMGEKRSGMKISAW